jgi:hypothetical protein
MINHDRSIAIDIAMLARARASSRSFKLEISIRRFSF